MGPVYSGNPDINRSLRHSNADAIAYSVMSGAGETYFSAFALLLRASASQVALLTTLPPLLGSMSQLLSVWLGGRLQRRKPIILAGAVLQALAWPPLIVLPLIYPHAAIPILFFCITCYYAGGSLTTPLWASLMGDLVPERRRGRYFGNRTRMATITAFLALICAGAALDVFDRIGHAVHGFVVVFAVAATARWVSVYHLSCMHEPVLAAHGPARLPWPDLLRDRRAWSFTVFIALMQGTVAIAAPFFAVYMLRDLQFSYAEFTANIGMAVLVQFLTLNTWGRIGDVFGNRLILVTTGAIIPLLPALWLVSPNFWYLMCIQVVAGFAWAGFSLSTGNFLYDLVAAGRRAQYMAVHNVVVACAVFAGGALGALLAVVLATGGHPAVVVSQAGSVLLPVFAVSSLARAAVALWFLPRLEEVRHTRARMSARDLVFRVTRFNAFSGLLYEAIAVIRRERRG